MQFVRSIHPQWRPYGIGKLLALNPGSEEVEVEYFISPAENPQLTRQQRSELRSAEPPAQERVYYKDGDEEGNWRVARMIEHGGWEDSQEWLYLIAGGNKFPVPTARAYVRSNLPLANPISLLKAQVTETAFWHSGRMNFVSSLLHQRAAFRGLSGLASANIELHQHQIGIAQRILSDPVPRYLLADEVGLGKTIEAGIVIRQLRLDGADEDGTLVLAPAHLVEQWREQLQRLFYLAPEDVPVLSHEDPAAAEMIDEGKLSMLVVDEAHLLARHAFSEGAEGEAYRRVRDIAGASHGLLLLSATPVLHNENAFLGMLHLIDPDTHSLEHPDRFHDLVKNRGLVADAVSLLTANALPAVLETKLESLRPLAVGDQPLQQLLDEMASPEEDTESRLKGYLQERFQLDHRILRTRRAQDSVEPDLPKRSCTYPDAAVEDQKRAEIWEWLEEWRQYALSSDERNNGQAEVFFTLLRASLSHPHTLSGEVGKRIDALIGGANPVFEEELRVLQRAPESDPIEVDPRVLLLRQLISEASGKWVVFISDSDVCRQVADYLGNIFPRSIVALYGENNVAEAAIRFRNEETTRVILCDHLNEDGLNLQGVGARIFHFDFPFEASRIEQRIGRLDRLASTDPEVCSYIPFSREGSTREDYEVAWVQCLDDTLQIFSRSVASLQHVIDSGRRHLEENVLGAGASAMEELEGLWGEGGAEGIDSELRQLRRQDILDQIDRMEDESFDFFELIEEYEYPDGEGSRGNLFGRAVSDWAVESLRFKEERKGQEPGSPRRFRFFPRRALITQDVFRNWFLPSFWQDGNNDGQVTRWSDYERGTAHTKGFELLRVGHPFVNGLESALGDDERGRAFAFWREVSDYSTQFGGGDPTGVYLRFDFFVELEHRKARGVIDDWKLSAGAVRRRCEAAFPPLTRTLWLDIDGQEVLGEELKAELESPFAPGAGDRNIHAEEWEVMNDSGLYRDFPELCDRLEAKAREMLPQAVGLSLHQGEGETHLQNEMQSILEVLRMRALRAGSTESDISAVAREHALNDQLLAMIQDPAIRLDSVGAVFLSEEGIPQRDEV